MLDGKSASSRLPARNDNNDKNGIKQHIHQLPDFIAQGRKEVSKPFFVESSIITPFFSTSSEVL